MIGKSTCYPLTMALFAGTVAANPVPQEQPKETRPQFEVASIVPVIPNPAVAREVFGTHVFPGGRVTFRGCSVAVLVMRAYDVQPFQVSGGPDWVRELLFDIEAKPPTASPSSRLVPAARADLNEEQRLMLQSLLAERFGVKLRIDTVESPAYALTRRPGGSVKNLTAARDKLAFPWSGGLKGGMVARDGMVGQNISMAGLATRLTNYFERAIVDRTGLQGSFDFRCEYRSDEARPELTVVVNGCLNYLGLKLVPIKAPVVHIVIEHADKPAN